jgi:pimeloyl-ACP methyl ester carboxylesterase
MKPQEARALSRLTSQVLAGTVAHVEQVHTAVARRTFGLTPAGAPVQTVHNAIAGGVYGSLRGAVLAAGSAAGGVVGLLPRPAARPIGSRPRANVALGALNAAIGDRLGSENSALAIRMSLRSDGCDVPAESAALAAAYPDAGGKLAIFLHGLGETEQAWRLRAEQHYGDSTVTYGSRLRDELGFTPVYVRYNTGLHVSDNGRRLAGLLTDVTDAWPAAVEEVVIVAHSMGGLVARSACHYGAETHEPWVPAVRDVFYLGAPHLGAPLERFVGFVGWTLSKSGDTRPWAELVNGRSAGIKDLRFGYLLDDDWRDCDPDTCREDHRHDVPLLPTANHYVISATITTDPDHPFGQIVGDLLVQPASAHGRHRRGRHITFDVDNNRYRLGGSHHFDLLNHPAIYDVMRARLER